MYGFIVVIEKEKGSYSAYCPYLPGCFATGRTRKEVEQNIYEAIEMHVNGLIEDNIPIAEQHTYSEYVLINAAA